jgi:hypothetical protein
MEKTASPKITSIDSPVIFSANKEDHFGVADVLTDAKDIVTHVIHVADDENLSPWTFRAFFLGKSSYLGGKSHLHGSVPVHYRRTPEPSRLLRNLHSLTFTYFSGIGLAIFASVLQEIYYFKPQAIYISLVFITVIAYALGEFMALLPRINPFFKFLNPFPFNSKEHAFILIMASGAATSAVSTEILAAQKLYYNMDPNAGAAVFLVISSQLLGFGIAGLLRSVLVQPTRSDPIVPLKLGN